jgi:hypothetical protein
MCGAPERLSAFGARTCLWLSQQKLEQNVHMFKPLHYDMKFVLFYLWLTIIGGLLNTNALEKH